LVNYNNRISEIKRQFKPEASAIISRDGTLLAGDLPTGITAETFTIMCATMMGAAVTAHSELRIGQPKIIRITSVNHEVMMVGAGRKAMIVLVLPKGVDTEEVYRGLGAIVGQMGD
jgi:predicted regulator of Ras-like GTPase activity (Roadblock/LC7/MglB family)